MIEEYYNALHPCRIMANQAIANGMDDLEPKPHFVLIPLMAQGHMIPMIDLAQLLAHRGALVTFVTTPLNASRLRITINRARDTGLPIRFLELPFPCRELGLPDGCENVDVVPLELNLPFFEGMRLLAAPLEQYLREQQPYPNCMIADICHPWTRELAANLRIPRLSFFSICCFTLLCNHNIGRDFYDAIVNEQEPFLVPGLKLEIMVTKAQAPPFFHLPGWKDFAKKVDEAQIAADGVVVNTFDELEPSYVESYKKAMEKKVWALGPFSLYNKKLADMAARGNKASVDTDRCHTWLETMKPRSVLYVSFGSLTVMDASQLMEIGLGLEASSQPFVWVIKNYECSEEVVEWLSNGFEARVGSRGLIIKGWSPQMMILSHPAIGGFLTHCGWNSTLEALSAGVPLITWPQFADQFLNERMVVDIAKVAVSVGVKEPSMYVADGKKRLLVTKDDVERAIRRVMDEGEEAEGRRKRAKELAHKAKEAMEVGGSSYANMTNLIRAYKPDDIKVREGK